MTTEDEKMTEESKTETVEETVGSTETTAADAGASNDAAAQAEAATEEAAEASPSAAAAPAAATETAAVNGGGEDYDPSVVGAAAHLFGISRPQDEYGTRSIDRDGMSDDELLAMGVEPDAGPGAKISLTFVAMSVVLMLTSIGAAALFGAVNAVKGDAISGRVHPLLAQQLDSASEVLNSYAELEGGNYRVPIAAGMDILVGAPNLLEGHPLGSDMDPAEPEPAGFYVRPAAPAPVPTLTPTPVDPSARIGQPQVQPGQAVGIAIPAGTVPVPVGAGADAHADDDSTGHDH